MGALTQIGLQMLQTLEQFICNFLDQNSQLVHNASYRHDNSILVIKIAEAIGEKWKISENNAVIAKDQ